MVGSFQAVEDFHHLTAQPLKMNRPKKANHKKNNKFHFDSTKYPTYYFVHLYLSA